MSVVIVGGHDRMHCRYKEICKRFGCNARYSPNVREI